MKLERIVVATDFSEPARAALEHAVAIAARYQARLYLFHAIDPRATEDLAGYREGKLEDLYELAERRAREELVAHCAPLGATVPIVECIRIGAPADEVPALKGTLVQVDDAMVAHDWHGARQTLEALLEQVANARQSGTISSVQAARIRAAAHGLLDRLPAP